MRNILLTCAENTDFNNLFKNLEKFPCIITFDNCGGSFNSIFSGNLQVICRQENYKEIQKINCDDLFYRTDIAKKATSC